MSENPEQTFKERFGAKARKFGGLPAKEPTVEEFKQYLRYEAGRSRHAEIVSTPEWSDLSAEDQATLKREMLNGYAENRQKQIEAHREIRNG